MAGPALGAVLIGLALAAPFAAAAGLYLAGAFLMLGLHAVQSPRAAPRDWRAELADGLTFLRREPFLRRLVCITGAWTLLADMALIALVLHAQEDLGLDAPAHGLVLVAGALGGVLGGLAGARAVRWFGPGRTAQRGSVIGIPVFLALPYVPAAVAAAVLVAFEFGGLLWNAVSTAYRQRRVPDALRGRVHAIYRLVSFAEMPLGLLFSGAMVEAAQIWLPRGTALMVPVYATVLGMFVLNIRVWRDIRRGFDGG
ncbi:MFS transporter [Jannaschia seohaensis]|uniref:MFS transporter n=1 Tax=Jannaschia seohaensis TaxID=475081 RepID=A0A2Y9A5L9_9RHOB|nr:MFS transporter [Jannaschia seohaensis]PWJ22470.1 MFS transporter [Jannaschia seohaensis]SSA38748.1 Major Facilitator Superfamily protein [Jannaschia seohaensis]